MTIIVETREGEWYLLEINGSTVKKGRFTALKTKYLQRGFFQIELLRGEHSITVPVQKLPGNYLSIYSRDFDATDEEEEAVLASKKIIKSVFIQA